jgi:D-inositol-3-phosphate glycosyltransferase
MNVYVRELSRQLGQRGYLVDVFTRRSDTESPEVVPIERNVRLVHLRAGPLRQVEKEDLRRCAGEFERSLVRFQETYGLRYDIVHSHYWLSGSIGQRLQERWGVPHVTMFHTLGEVKNRSRITERESSERIRTERELARGADRIVCASQHEKHLLERLYGADPDHIAVVPCGVDLDLFKPADKESARKELGFSDEHIILFVGRIEPLKGLDILISAAAQLEHDPHVYVLIVGGDNRSQAQVDELQGLASGLGIGQRVCFLGAVDHEKLPLFYNAADVLVMPSFYESFGLVALEAMACGTPVVASRVGGLTSAVSDGETGYLVSWRCPEPFAERLDLLLENEDLRRNLGQAAREAMKRFRWANVAEAIDNLYRELLADRPPAAMQEDTVAASAGS